jgi:hypothetical protein
VCTRRKDKEAKERTKGTTELYVCAQKADPKPDRDGTSHFVAYTSAGTLVCERTIGKADGIFKMVDCPQVASKVSWPLTSQATQRNILVLTHFQFTLQRLPKPA